MKNYMITQVTEEKAGKLKFYCTNEKSAQLMYHWTEDREKADKFTFAEVTKLLETINQFQRVGNLLMLSADDLNGIGETTLKLITKTIQEPNPVKFSLLCEEHFKAINPESLLNYSITLLSVPTNKGNALIYCATFQYWASEAEFKTWIEELNRSNLLIKP